MNNLLACFAVLAAAAAGGQNPVVNPGFELDADHNGVPDGWQAAGDSRQVTQSLGLDEGRDGGHAARLDCTRFSGGGGAAHAMLCQMGVPVRRGVHYRLSFWARGRRIADDVVSVALSDTKVWENCGLSDGFVPTPDWKHYQFLFQATRDCTTATRMQIWYTSTGTLWVDDVVLEEVGPEVYRPGQVLPTVGGKNLLAQSGFECGTDAWGSAEWDRTTHWGGPMNRLFGSRDTSEAFEGQASLKIDLNRQNQPVSYFDYYELSREPIRAPLAASLGYVEVEPGRPYTLSVYLKAAKADTPARLAVRQFRGRTFERAVRVSTEWQRQSLTFTPSSRWCYVLAGPDLRPDRDNSSPPEEATVWLDAFQLEAGDAATAYQPRLPYEFSLSTDKVGNVFGWDEPIRIRLVARRVDPADDRPGALEIRMTDFFGREVLDDRTPVGSQAELVVDMPPDSGHRGFFRVVGKLTVDSTSTERTMRMAVIPIHDGDSRFGVNHAYPWPHLLDLSRKAGLEWVRDWSLKWQDVEPREGQFTFAETDYQIDRPLEHGLEVLGLVPFPSSNWASEAPPDVGGSGYPQNRERAAYAPRDVGQFQNFIGRTVSHYKDRLRWWQVFNEPLYTSYSLPRAKGYDATDYARLTADFAKAARQADPGCRILAGIGGLSDGQIMDDFEQFFAGGGLAAVDAVDFHNYPRLRPPEFIAGLLEKLNSLMDEHGGRKPIWNTEYGYYADDDPAELPMPHSSFDSPLESEELQAAYAVRWATLAFAGGVEKIFYHAGTCDGVNRDSLQGIFYEYGGQPHKIYAAQAVMSHLLTPTARFEKRLSLGEGVWGYAFRDDDRRVAVVWATAAADPKPIELANGMQPWDLMGRPQAKRSFTPSDMPVYILSEGPIDLPQ